MKIFLDLSLGYIFCNTGDQTKQNKNKESQLIFPSSVLSGLEGRVWRGRDVHFNTIMEQAVWGKVFSGFSRNLDHVQVKSRMCAFLSANT